MDLCGVQQCPSKTKVSSAITLAQGVSYMNIGKGLPGHWVLRDLPQKMIRTRDFGQQTPMYRVPHIPPSGLKVEPWGRVNNTYILIQQVLFQTTFTEGSHQSRKIPAVIHVHVAVLVSPLWMSKHIPTLLPGVRWCSRIHSYGSPWAAWPLDVVTSRETLAFFVFTGLKHHS